MPAHIHIGCCGWSYLDEKEFREPEGLRPGHSKLQAYVRLFDSVEINSTFYRLPRLSTAERWRKEADEVNPGFGFTVKVYQGITHLHRFRKKESLDTYRIIKDICSVLRSNLVLFQSPASFKPSPENIDAMTEFFDKIDREGIVTAWEPRGKWYDDSRLVEKVCADCKLVHCVDPFRNDALVLGKTKTAYFRLHGFGKPSMYQYDFSEEELYRLQKKIDSLSYEMKYVYVFFNNAACYGNAAAFQKMLAK
ncbi:MAG TPA: DUF72 domain-containing protein [Candidatus Acidoferrales bacterium]|nr:DUF72 domain-containing protein [Candidatus Acidoferrales bacterium]